MGFEGSVKLPLGGGCQCGSIRYEVTEMPLTLYACHCTECQKQSSSGFGMSMTTARTGFRVVKGEPKYWYRNSESGNKVSCAFCSDCGTRLFHLPSRNEETVNIKPGTLDETKWLKPVGHVWISSAQTWMNISADALIYEAQPESYKELYEAWDERMGCLV